MNTTDRQVLALLAAALFGKPFSEEVADWNAVAAECQVQKVSAVANLASPPGEKALEMAAARSLAQNINISMAHCSLHSLLTENGIPYVILKGCASAFYYPQPTSRAMGDVDFLVAREDVLRVGQVLLENGFRKTEEETGYHQAFRKDGVSYELHFEVNGIPEGEVGNIIKTHLEDTVKTGRPADIRFGKIMLPDDFHHGLIILLHNARHMVSSGLGLRHLCDWAVFVNRIPDFPALFEVPLRKMGLWIYACQMTALCCRYLGLPGQDWCGTWKDDLMDAMIEDIVGAGNFGRKREDGRDSKLIGNVSSGGVSRRSMLGQLFRYMSEDTKKHWPAARKCKLLLPIGWICYAGRYLVRMARGERKMINVRVLVGNARNRKSLYSQLKLFETE